MPIKPRIEARNKRGKLFVLERARAIAPQGSLEIAETAQTFGQDDDITVVIVERLAAIEVADNRVSAPTMESA